MEVGVLEVEERLDGERLNAFQVQNSRTRTILIPRRALAQASEAETEMAM
jgi:hypothetical protein